MIAGSDPGLVRVAAPVGVFIPPCRGSTRPSSATECRHAGTLHTDTRPTDVDDAMRSMRGIAPTGARSTGQAPEGSFRHHCRPSSTDRCTLSTPRSSGRESSSTVPPYFRARWRAAGSWSPVARSWDP